MKYWVGRILLKSGELVTERELLATENSFEGTPPEIGDLIRVHCRDRELNAKVVWLTWPVPGQSENSAVLRVQEI